MLVLKLLWKLLMGHFESIGKDPRTNHYPLINNYLYIILVTGLYLLLTLKIGPQFMAKRKPYNLKSVIQIYNIFQILMNLYIFYGITRYHYYSPKYIWTCMTYDPTDVSEHIMKFRLFMYLYYINKIVDFLDTFFFILRKKFNQVSFLHVYHHTGMAYGGFVYMNGFLGSQFTVIGHLNSFVHVLMYTYYFLSALETKLNLNPWKPYMTRLQILQFGYFTVKLFVSIINQSWCKLSDFWLISTFVQNLFMTAMFTNFYYKAYINAKEVQKKLNK